MEEKIQFYTHPVLMPMQVCIALTLASNLDKGQKRNKRLKDIRGKKDIEGKKKEGAKKEKRKELLRIFVSD